MANIVLLSANQIADIFYVSDKPQFFFGKKKQPNFMNIVLFGKQNIF